MTASKTLKISRLFHRNKFPQRAINSANNDRIKNMQWYWRGLANKISELLEFLKEKDIDIVYLKEVKRWHKEHLTDKYFVVTETRASKSQGSMIFAKKRTTITEVKLEKFDKNERRKLQNNESMLSSTCFRSSLGHSSQQLTKSRFESVRNF